MGFSTLSVAAAVTPTVIQTSVAHYLHRKPLKQKPTAHLSYDVGLKLIRKFLDFASHHTVEQLQSFTGQWVPSPRWVKVEEVEMSGDHIESAASALKKQIGSADIGGHTWWQWRDKPLKAEWIEMRRDYNRRKGPRGRCMLYVHGGAYFFGSVDEHRYQMQRHARKLKARVLAPRYRLAPQFPFPCGLLDCLATYQYLLTVQEPSTIVLAGDSAGGAMILSLLIIIRDQGLPMPAGAILISPWVDLTHSFPSVVGDSTFDYIPENGFLQRPSMSWPPPNLSDIKRTKSKSNPSVQEDSALATSSAQELSLQIDGKLVNIIDQIQMYAPNHLLSHPLVSPVLQPSLGGLPPMLVLVGGGEMLRDEQIYLAHRAAAPEQYPAPPVVKAWGLPTPSLPPTRVQLQVWDDMCHVGVTLSFTRPARFMYRSIAQFGAWALAQAQNREIRITDDEAMSMSSESTVSDSQRDSIGKAGDTLPKFSNSMIRQRVTRHGDILPLAPAASLPACQVLPEDIGVIKPGPVRKWMQGQEEWERRYGKERRRLLEQRIKESPKYIDTGEDPPPTALVGRRKTDYIAPTEKRKGSALAIWSGMGSKHDKDIIERETEVESVPEKIILPEISEQRA